MMLEKEHHQDESPPSGHKHEDGKVTVKDEKPRIKTATKKEKAAASKAAAAATGKGNKSCSECRRLKAKCDRVFPCSNCKYTTLTAS